MSLAVFMALSCHDADKNVIAVAHKRDFKIFINKKDYTLKLFSDTTLLKTYKCSFGRNPKGAKEIEGDNKTPVGKFYISSKKVKSRFHRFLGLSYPTNADAIRGLKQHLITTEEYEAIITAIRNKQQPPQETKLGGYIGIHGNGRWDFILSLLPWHVDWTQGCIALSNQDIEELFNLVNVGTQVEIIE